MIVSITGKAGSGKSCVARMLIERFGAVEVSLADPIKRIARELFGFTDEQLWGPSHCRNAADFRLPRPDAVRFAWCLEQHVHGPECGDPLYLTPRYALQTLGSWGRDCYEHVWIDAALRLAAQHPLAVVPDVRYRNELERVRRGGGVMLRIVRPGAGLSGAAADHPSETEQDSIPDDAFDVVIENTGTLEDLRDAVDFVGREYGLGPREAA